MKNKPENILVCVAWPYVNGEPHLGHIAGNNLPADIFARYHRMVGNNVLMVSGSDQHGTPVTIRAKEENTTPREISEKYHNIWSETFKDLDFSFDLYTKTGTENHKEVVQKLFNLLNEKGYLQEKVSKQPYSEESEMFLSDRYIEGDCPHCPSRTKGDQCDNCGKDFEPIDLKNLISTIDNSKVTFKETNHIYLKLPEFQEDLNKWIKSKSYWKPAVKNQSLGFLSKGLIDRAITRDIDWGVEVPIKNYEKKRIYVWFEAVIGYLSASIEWAESDKNISNNKDIWKEWWQNPESKHFYFQGKDNIPFHTIILPAILMGSGEYNLPYDVVANEYLNFSGKQFSKSKNWAVWVSDFLKEYDSEALRYYLTSIMPESSDSDFTWDSFFESNNNELVATFGNLVNRIQSLIKNNFDNVVPNFEKIDDKDNEMISEIKRSFESTGNFLEKRQFRNSLKEIMNLAKLGNRYIDQKEPWASIKSDKQIAANTLWVGANLISNLGVLISPFLPKTSLKISSMFNFGNVIPEWKYREAKSGIKINNISPLFKKIEIEK
ncbi:MAG: methionine--tRNA ligase [Chloroflexota bacterium]|nr:methionine--tRNA ligase [Chloroflexota bacterium]MEC8712938.1 methionine--tRNA ligase [Chloroflexota bacterium]MEE2620445.1 methionine--tRNA ligase [Chloroflexota bacterium]